MNLCLIPSTPRPLALNSDLQGDVSTSQDSERANREIQVVRPLARRHYVLPLLDPASRWEQLFEHRTHLCVDCKAVRHSPGRPRCNHCHSKYVEPTQPDGPTTAPTAVNFDARNRVAAALNGGDTQLGVAVALIETMLGGVIVDEQPLRPGYRQATGGDAP